LGAVSRTRNRPICSVYALAAMYRPRKKIKRTKKYMLLPQNPRMKKGREGIKPRKRSQFKSKPALKTKNLLLHFPSLP